MNNLDKFKRKIVALYNLRNRAVLLEKQSEELLREVDCLCEEMILDLGALSPEEQAEAKDILAPVLAADGELGIVLLS